MKSAASNSGASQLRPPGSPDEIAAEPVRQQLEKILASPGFARAERLGKFLRFIVEQTLQGKAEELKETVIGVEVFGRKPDYDPREDSIVRVEAGRLRSRLVEYYVGPGSGDPVAIELAVGSYVPAFRTVREDRVERPRRWASKAVALGVAGAVAVAALVVAVLWRRTPPRPALSSIVVLPFANLSSDPENEYFSDGITEELIHSLANAGGLRVISQTSSFALKGKPPNIPEIGARLHVDAVLEGSVRRAENRVRITAQLIRVSDDSHLWSQKYDRELRDVFAIQDEIARSIVNELRVRLPAGSNGPSPRRYTENLEAYNLYLKGRYLWDRRAPKESLAYLEQAVARDPNYAPAYAAIADSYIRLGNHSEYPLRETYYRKAKEAAGKALEIDPLLAEAYVPMGWLSGRERNPVDQEKRYRRALELNPNYALAHRFYGMSLMAAGRREEGIRETRRAQDLDPLSVDISATLAMDLLTVGRYDEALDQAKKAYEMGPNSSDAQGVLGRCYVQKGMYAEAVRVFVDSKSPWLRGLLGYAYGVSGQSAEARRILDEEIERSRRAYVSPVALATLYTGLGDKDHAFEWLEKARKENHPQLGMVRGSPEFASLRSDPRYSALVKRMDQGP